MIKKICPICDMEMKIPHYCRYCRQFVRQPLIRDVTHRLNEPHFQNTKQRNYNTTMDTLMQKKDHHSIPASPERGYVSERRKKSLAPLLVVLVPLVFTLAFLYLRPVKTTEVVKERLEYGDVDLGAYTGKNEEEYDLDEDGLDEDDLDEYYGEHLEVAEHLDTQLVRSLGIHCSLVEHFAITLAEIEQEMHALIVGLGISEDVVYQEDAADNILYTSGETWYSMGGEYVIAGESDNECIFIDIDTATGELHDIFIVLEDSESFFGLIRGVFQILEEHREVSGLFSDAGITETNIREIIEGDHYYSGECEGIYVDVLLYHEDEYWCMIYK